MFRSDATNLDPTPTGSHYFLWRAADDSVTELPAGSYQMVVSGDGSVVAIGTTYSYAPEDQNPWPDVYLYFAATDTLLFVPSPYFLDSSNYGLAISDDGRDVWWKTNSGPNAPHLFQYDTVTETFSEPIGPPAVGVVMLPDRSGYVQVQNSNGTCTGSKVTFSPSSTTPIHPPCTWNSMSADGRWAAWWTPPPALPRAQRTDTSTGETLTFTSCGNFQGELSIDDSGRYMLVKSVGCRLSVLDWNTMQLRPVDRTFDGQVPRGTRAGAALSADGSTVIYTTDAPNVLAEPAPYGGIYLVDLTALG